MGMSVIDPFTWETDHEDEDDEPLFTMPTPQRFREIPGGATIATFDAFLTGGRFDTKGNVEMKFVVEMEEKYKAMPLTDYIGMMFQVKVVKRDIRRRGDS